MVAWILGDELGRGALGRVVRVRDPDAGRELAGKILHRSHRADPRAVARLEAEARLLAEVRHANLVGVHGLIDLDGERVLLMDLVDGPTLATVIARDAPLPPARAVALTRGIAAGLVAAHHAGLVHRDLKPANILVAPSADGVGTPRLVDFGLARATALTGVTAGDLVVVGTPAYMAPEAVDPMAVDTRSDLYALGCILFELLTGRPPFDGATAIAVLEAHREAPVPALSGVPDELAALVGWLLAKSPADRPQSAAAALAALEAGTGAPGTAGAALAVRGSGAVTGPAAAEVGARCVGCGARLIREVPVCFGCRADQITATAGDHTVFVTGPGIATHKLDAQLRTRLLEWIQRTPTLGLAPKRLVKTVPRLPFVLVADIDPVAAAGLVAALAALGLEGEAIRGNRYVLPAIRKKGKTMAGRYVSVAAVSAVPGMHSLGVAAIPVIGLVAAIASITGYRGSARPACDRLEVAATALPGELAHAIARVGAVVRMIEEARHRDALRGVVERALALAAAVPADEAARIGTDLARVVDVATVAASKLDELERGLDAASLHGGDASVRGRLRERDVWAARLLEVTARLDALRARWAAARADAAGDADLDELRAQLEAFEELRALTEGA